jgi:hypothetical protein
LIKSSKFFGARLRQAFGAAGLLKKYQKNAGLTPGVSLAILAIPSSI